MFERDNFNISGLAYLYTEYVPDFITDSQKNCVALVLGVIMCGVISIFGIVANIINMIVFFKQGLNTTINICFFSMAVSDLGSLVSQQLINLYNNPLFVDLDLPIVYHEFQYFTAILREIFAKITFLLTVYVTTERCFCIAFPLHVKQMITPRRTTTIIIVVYVTMILSFIPVYTTVYIAKNFYSNRNRTLFGLVFRKNKELVDGLVFLFHSILGFLAFITVVILTGVLIYKLNQKKTWLHTANVYQSKSESVSNRDKATMSMVILIASILIICYFPSVILSSVTICVPAFNIGGRYTNTFIGLWAISVLMHNVNSSVNIFFYYKMSSKYRQTLRTTFLKYDC